MSSLAPPNTASSNSSLTDVSYCTWQFSEVTVDSNMSTCRRTASTLKDLVQVSPCNLAWLQWNGIQGATVQSLVRLQVSSFYVAHSKPSTWKTEFRRVLLFPAMGAKNTVSKIAQIAQNGTLFSTSQALFIFHRFGRGEAVDSLCVRLLLRYALRSQTPNTRQNFTSKGWEVQVV